ncbi:MAG: glycoside hydrolase family 5 protein, partial [Saprospiraceae bacterium]
MVTWAGVFSQPIIYNDLTTLITGTWDENGTLEEITTNVPQEGTHHYRFSYSYTAYWAGFGLNMNNWGASSARDFTGYTHLRIAYRGLTGSEGLSITLRGAGVDGNTISLGGPMVSYVVIDIPLLSFTAGTSLSIDAVTELMLSVGNSNSTGSGTVYIDNIYLVNQNTTNTTSATTWQRANSMHKGINLSNWLEAYWLIPFNAYPETNKYTAATFSNFRSLGIDAVRMPITFEHLAGATHPYTLNTNHPAFSLIDDAIDWAATYDMKLIIDMHHGTTTLTDANYLSELPRLTAIWEQIVARYASLDPERYFFEIYNEPHAISNANFRVVAQALVDVIRNAGATHSVIVGASGYNSGTELLSFTPLNDPDIIYTFHYYEPYFFTHQQMSWTTPAYLAATSFPVGNDLATMQSRIDAVGQWSNFYNAPVMLGEFGVSANADLVSRCNWVSALAQLLDDNNLAWF